MSIWSHLEDWPYLVMMMMMMMMKVLLQIWPMDGKERLCLAKMPNTYFYRDSRPEVRIIRVTDIEERG